MLLIFLFYSLVTAGISLSRPTDSIPDSFHLLSAYPEIHLFAETPPFDQSGGHIQGIQLQYTGHDTIAFLSGSSTDIAYMAKVRLSNGIASILSIDTLLQTPFRHAGGFQLLDQHLAIGIEDNHLRTSSRVLVYDVSLTNNPWENPVFTVERSGPYERSTAGAVGITNHKGNIILAVADWNARNLDFFSLSEKAFRDRTSTFEPISSLEIDRLDRKHWSDAAWHAYQNINLISDQENLYLVGLARSSSDQQVVDLFTVTFGEGGEIATPALRLRSSSTFSSPKAWSSFTNKTTTLQKIASKEFQPSTKADFRAAGGIHFENDNIQVLAAPYTLSENLGINIFSKKTLTLPTSTRLGWTQAEAFSAREAHQAAAADDRFFYAINNTQVAQYDRKTGSLNRVAQLAESIHLNSGFFYMGKLYLAHSKYPQKPDRSDIRVLDPVTMEGSTVVDFGETDGSLTWVVRHQGYWWGMFAHYKENNAASYLVKWNADWQEITRYHFPQEVIKHLGTMSVSGGVPYEDGFLITGHDDRELFYVRLPAQGNDLEYVNTYPAPFTGQGIATDPLTGGLIGINRKEKKVVFGAPARP